MSRDIFVQDIPPDAHTVAETHDSWMPSPLPLGPDEVMCARRTGTLLMPLNVRTFDPEGAEQSGIFGNG
jgi:hypothetical protein